MESPNSDNYIKKSKVSSEIYHPLSAVVNLGGILENAYQIMSFIESLMFSAESVLPVTLFPMVRRLRCIVLPHLCDEVQVIETEHQQSRC